MAQDSAFKSRMMMLYTSGKFSALQVVKEWQAVSCTLPNGWHCAFMLGGAPRSWCTYQICEDMAMTGASKALQLSGR